MLLEMVLDQLRMFMMIMVLFPVLVLSKLLLILL